MGLSLLDMFSLLENGNVINTNVININEEMEVSHNYKQADIDFIVSYFSQGFNNSAPRFPAPENLPEIISKSAHALFKLSPVAFDNFIHSWMSELPIEKEIAAFGRKVLAAAHDGGHHEECRRLAEKTAADRGDEDVSVVLKAAMKVQHEIHRMLGFLRFLPDSSGKFIARCEPDHFVIPAMSGYFRNRFGKTAWVIIDEKRGLCLNCRNKERPCLTPSANQEAAGNEDSGDEWEALWRHYHKTINNESRSNPKLQHQFMPKRYWKHLPEFDNL